MNTKTLFAFAPLICAAPFICSAQTNLKPSDTEVHTPKPRIVTIQNRIPSDAIVLFGGKDLSEWEKLDKPGSDAQWTVKDGLLIVKPGTGDIQTKRKFEDFQLHLEWKSPEIIKGEGQGRGNSGVYLHGLYEIQILDNDDNPTYVNGQAGSLYKQRPPLVEVRAGERRWHRYDIICRAPRFNRDGMLVSKGTVTVLHNGVVVQNNTVIDGSTEYIGLPKVIPHGPGPIVLQDHGDLVSFRNIWIREL